MYVYGLSAKGVSHALRNGYSTSATKTLDEHLIRTLDHELELTSFHVVLHRLCAANGLRYLWRQKDLKHTVHPDAHFYIADPANPGKAFCYFLEIERRNSAITETANHRSSASFGSTTRISIPLIVRRNGDSGNTG